MFRRFTFLCSTFFEIFSRNFALRRSDIEVLVREATSNEKWGPSGTQMSQIAMATHNYNDFNIIMNTLWERLNDDGKNWRHIYKVKKTTLFIGSQTQ